MPQGTVTHCNKSLLCLCTSSGTHTHNYHSKILDHFCCFIQQKQRCTRQRIRSKTHTSQLTVQLQPNHQCCLRYLCCTCPKTEFKEKHYRGQGQHPVQSSEALMGFPSQGTGGWFYLNDRSSRVHWYLPGSTAHEQCSRTATTAFLQGVFPPLSFSHVLKLDVSQHPI